MRAAGEPVAAKRVVDQLVGDDAGVVCAVSDADKRRFAEGPRVADAESHRLRPVRIEVIGAVAHGATICRAVHSVKSERLIDIGAAAPASYPMARAQKVR
jgi:hypothetical protein